MTELKVDGVVHWSIPLNNLEEAEKFYGEPLGLEPKGCLGGSGMSCFKPVITTFCYASATRQPSELRNKTTGFITRSW